MDVIGTEVSTDEVAAANEPTVAAWQFAADAAFSVDEARRRIFHHD